MPPCRSTAWPIVSISSCVAPAPRCSKTSCRGTSAMQIGNLGYLPETPSQTAGPYVHIGLIPHQAGFDIFERPFSNVLTGPDTQGQRIAIEGRVFDGLGAPCRDVLVEIWQANAAGRYNHPADPQRNKPLDPDFRGWGRTGTDFATGLYRFETVKPGPVVGRHGHKPMAPHVNVWLAA